MTVPQETGTQGNLQPAPAEPAGRVLEQGRLYTVEQFCGWLNEPAKELSVGPGRIETG